MECLTILPGHDKRGTVESFLPIHLKRGQLYTIVHNIYIRSPGDSRAGVKGDGLCIIIAVQTAQAITAN